MEAEECCSESAIKGIDQVEGEFKGSVLIWNDV